MTKQISIYLDLNHWYALGEASAGRSSRVSHVGALQQLRSLVKRETVVTPLSATHHMEIAENGRDRLRLEVAKVMAELSQFRTLAPAKIVLEEELDTELNARFGRPTDIRRSPRIGWGVGFAFGRPARFRVAGDASTVAEVGPERIAALEAQANAYAEFMLICGPPFTERSLIQNYDPLVARRTADVELARIRHMVAALRERPDLHRRLDDVVAAQEYVIEVFDLWKEAAARAGLGQPMDRAYVTSFLMALPSRRVSVGMKRRYLQDLNHKWTVNDIRDMAALSVAVPYCDVVVTDRAACAALTSSGLDEVFATVILKNLDDLSQYLQKLAA